MREDLINGAVSFLQDPSVASAPLEQRIAFLRSKNLTQEEIDVSLARVGTDSGSGQTSQSQAVYQQQQPYRQPPPQYGMNQNAYWQQPPPEPPRRDWRDLFIMATVMSGVGYGVYFVAKRYIYPLVAPPTPPQLEQDKASVEASFDKTFAILEQLTTDTEELKSSEKTRTERLDGALYEIESVLAELKDAGRRRDDESRKLSDEVRTLKDSVPRAIDGQKESLDTRIKELGMEMKSLKTLISNRMAAQRTSTPAPSYAAYTNGHSNGTEGQNQSPAVNEPKTPSAVESGSNSEEHPPLKSVPPPAQVPDRTASSSPYGRMMNGRAAIPAWQMAASNKNQESEAKQDTSESGTAVDGATA